MSESLTVLEFFSGLGGWACALNSAGISHNIAAAFDVNPAANETYKYNHIHYPNDVLLSKNQLKKKEKELKNNNNNHNKILEKIPHEPCSKSIEGLTADILLKFKSNFWVMSPPCQPFTRNNQTECRDQVDPRSKAFSNLLLQLVLLDGILSSNINNNNNEDNNNILTNRPKYIALENVIGFETSDMCKIFLYILNLLGYTFYQYHLTPKQFNIPNDRPRYYCIAWLKNLNKLQINTNKLEEIKNLLLNNSNTLINNENYLQNSPVLVDLSKIYTNNLNNLQLSNQTLSNYIDNILSKKLTDEFLLSNDLINSSAGWCVDIRSLSSTSSSCFTKSYSRYVRGTGSVLLIEKRENEVDIEEEDIEEKEIEDNKELIETSIINNNKKRRKLIKEIELGGSIVYPYNIIELSDPSERKFHSNWFNEYLSSLSLSNSSTSSFSLRYFMPSELLKLFGFPLTYKFPSSISIKKQYELIGNSVNVTVISYLLQELFLLEKNEN